MIIGLVGRTNVGKSTLFNRLLGTFRAIVTDIAGTTRELLREECVLNGRSFELVDSPGLERFSEEKNFIQQIIDESDVILFVVDGKVELGEQDIVIRDMIMQSEKKKNTILLVNKLDGKVYKEDIQVLLADYYALGFEDVIPVSAKEEEGVMFVAEAIKKNLENRNQKLESREQKTVFSNKKQEIGEQKGEGKDQYVKKKYQKGEDGSETFSEEIDEEFHQTSSDLHQTSCTYNIAIVGRPNVGKSTLLNTLVGEEIAWVQDKPGTTLDYISAEFLFQKKKVILYDTAGIRKRGKTVGLEKIAYAKTLKMLEWIKPVVVVLIDLEEGLTHRDQSLIGELIQKGIGIMIALNKSDLFTEKEVKIFEKRIRLNLRVDRVPILKISGKEKRGLTKMLETAFRIQQAFGKRISTAKLNKVLKTAWIETSPRFPKNKICKWKYVTQVDDKPPTFFLSVNNKDYANFSFIAWIEKVLRKNFGFQGVPLRIKFGSKVEKNPYIKVKE